MDIFQKSITPDKPRVLAEEQIYVYVPMATSTNAGIASYNKDQFDIIGSEVSLKWPAESFAQGPIETPSIVKVLDNEFEYTGNLVDLISGNSKISSDKLEVQLKRILRDAYERPELVMLDPNYFVRTIVEKDGKQYYKYNTTAVHYNMSQNLSEDEQVQARQNISASSISDNEATNKRIDALLQTGVYTVNGQAGNVVLKNSDLENDTNYATEQYVQENGGKIDKILLNNEEQEIVDKVVNLIIDKTTVGLSNVDNTGDLDKPVSTKTQTALNTKMDKSGGIFTGNVGVQGNLSVSGTITTKDTETLKVQDNVIVTNANKIDLLDLSGLAINKNDTQTYGIMYDAVDDSVKLGLGSIGSDGKFAFNEGEGSPIATRSDSGSLTDNHLLKWDATNNKLVDSGYSAEDKLDKIINTDTYNRVYGINSDGTQTTYNVSVQPEKDSIVCRDYYGRIGSKNFYTNYINNFENWGTNSERHTRITLEPKSFEMVSCIGSQYSGLTFTNDTDTNSNDMSIFGEFMGSKTTPDYAKQIGFSMNYNNVSYLENGITLRVLENLQNGKILSLTQNGLFIGDGFDAIPEGEQTLPLKNKKEISPNSIRYDIEQTLTDEQKARARANIDASSISDNDALNTAISTKANKTDLSAVTDATLSSDSKTLTVTKRDGTSFDFKGGSDITSIDGLAGGNLTSNVSVNNKAKMTTEGYVVGTWLQATNTSDIGSSNWSDVWVNHNGWLYKRNKSDFINELGLNNYVPITRTINSKALSSDITLNNKDVGALPDYTLTISHQTAGNPRMVKFVSVNYASKATCFKMGAMTCHDNGSSYQFLTDMLIAVTTSGVVTANIYKFAQTSIGNVDGVARYTGDVFYINDTTNKIVDFYILCGQYSASQFTPVTKVGSTTIAYVTQYSGNANYYSSGDKVWVNGCGTTYARLSDIPTNYVTTDTEQTITGKKTFSTNGLTVSGRALGSGDDEGIVVSPASNNYAGICLGNPNGKRAVLYLRADGTSVWRYNNGSTSYDLTHPQKAGTIALTSDIPTFTLNGTTLEITL